MPGMLRINVTRPGGSERIVWVNVDQVTTMASADIGLEIRTADGELLTVTTTPVEAQIIADQIQALANGAGGHGA